MDLQLLLDAPRRVNKTKEVLTRHFSSPLLFALSVRIVVVQSYLPLLFDLVFAGIRVPHVAAASAASQLGHWVM